LTESLRAQWQTLARGPSAPPIEEERELSQEAPALACGIESHAGETIEGNENKVAATMDLRCPAGKEVKLFLNWGTCTIWIPEQTGLGSVTLETTPAAKPVALDFVLNLSSIKYKVQNGLLGCPNKPADGTYTNGTLAGTETLGGDNTKGEAIAFSAFSRPFAAGQGREPRRYLETTFSKLIQVS
jgi:hypothetical protein